MNKETLQNNNNRLAKNNLDLASVLDTINNLPEAGEGGASGGSALDVFIQPEQPDKTKGVWLKTDEDITVDHIAIKPYTETHATSVVDLETSTPTATSYNRVAKVGDYLYVFCGRLSSNSPTDVAYKHNIVTGETSTITNYPIVAMMQAIGCVGTDVYLFGGEKGNTYYKTSYKYDTLTDTYTQIADLPVELSQAGYVTVGTDIYIIGGYRNTVKTNMYKYDTLTDTYTELASVPLTTKLASVVAYGNYIYIFASGQYTGYNGGSYKYNILTNKHELISTTQNMPAQSHTSAARIGNSIFIIGGYNGSGREWVYHFNPRTNIFTQMNKLPVTRYNAGYVTDGKNGYLVGGQSSGGYLSTITKFSDTVTVDVETSTNELLIDTTKTTNIVDISDDITVHFVNMSYSNNEGDVQPVEVYTNNGETWEHL